LLVAGCELRGMGVVVGEGGVVHAVSIGGGCQIAALSGIAVNSIAI